MFSKQYTVSHDQANKASAWPAIKMTFEWGIDAR